MPVTLQPFDLVTGVPVGNIALVVLEAPGDNNEDIPLANPDFFLDLPLDPAHPGDPVKTPHPDVVGTHHQFGAGKNLPVPLVREADPDYLFWFSGPLLIGQSINSR